MPILDPFRQFTMQLAPNPQAHKSADYPEIVRRIINLDAFGKARDVISHWPGYAPTQLHALPNLAASADVAAIWYKDESSRFGLNSFKALGGAYAVCLLLAEQVRNSTGNATITPHDIVAGTYKHLTQNITVTTATDGNHGRAVAWGAQQFGCRCVIYIHAHVSEGRKRAIEAYGAEVRRITGNYDDSVHQARDDASANGWFVVSDTSYPGYAETPTNVMQGYTVMVDEALQQLPAGERPTHVFLQGGVGAMAAGVIGHLWELYRAERPTMVIVEPDQADCLYRSVLAGEPVTVHGDLDTMMAGLACGEVSMLAWEILSRAADYFMTIPDAAAIATMRLMAGVAVGSEVHSDNLFRGGQPPQDVKLVTGESAIPGLAGALTAIAHGRSHELGLTKESRILIFGTEGATDPELYTRFVGSPPEDIRR